MSRSASSFIPPIETQTADFGVSVVRDSAGISGEDVLSLFGLNHHADTVLCAAGSRVEGLSTGSSDLDLICVDDTASVGEMYRTVRRATNSLRIDLVFLTRPMIVDAAKRVADAVKEARKNETALARLGSEYQILHRVRQSFPLLNAQGHSKLQQIAFGIPLEEAMARHAILYLTAWQEDVIGFLEEEDTRSAAIVLSEFTGAIADVLLHTLGDTSPAHKLRFRRLRKRDGAIRGIRFFGLRLPDPFSEWYFEHAFCLMDAKNIVNKAVRAVKVANLVVPWSQHAFSENRTPIIVTRHDQELQ
jgi:hypothetical protein